MDTLRLLLIFIVLSTARSYAPRLSTHLMLRRLGFSPQHKSQGPAYSLRRVDDYPNKPRLNLGSGGNSPIYVVKLPPHSSYYSHFKPSFDAAVSQDFKSFAANGRPHHVYHSNRHRPSDKLLSRRRLNEDSKIYRIKISSPGTYKSYKHETPLRTMVQLNKGPAAVPPRTMSPNQNISTDMQRLVRFMSTPVAKSDTSEPPKYVIQYIPKFPQSKLSGKPSKLTDKPVVVYVPTLPAYDGSFYRLFYANGKPIAFYVIRNGRTTSLSRILKP